MYVVHGQIYTFTFESEHITIKSNIPGMHNVELESNYDEDFSVFDLGPAISDDVEMLAAWAKIDSSTKNNVYLHVIQSPDNFIKIDIRRQPPDIHSDPIGSGERIFFLKDNIRSIN